MSVKLDLKNKIINGSLEFWQRGLSFASIATETYCADRWIYRKSGAMVHTASRSTDVPTDAFGIYSMHIDCTTADASIAAGDYTILQQYIEGNVLRTFKNKKMVMKFRVKSTKTGIFCVGFLNAASSRSLVKEYTVNVTNTWETKTLRLSHDATGAWNYDIAAGMQVAFVLTAGTNINGATPDVWSSSGNYATVNQVNACDSVSNNFQIADVMFVEDNEGQTRNPDFQLAGRDWFEELQLCQRYFEKSYQLDTAPGSVAFTGNVNFNCNNSGFIQETMKFSVAKRTTVASAIYSPNTGAIGNVYRSTGGDILLTSVGGILYESQGSFTIDATSGFSTSTRLGIHWTADAEL